MKRFLGQIRADLFSCTLMLVTTFVLFHLELFTPGHKPSKISQFFQELEYQTFDYRMRARNRFNPPSVGDKVVVLNIDDASLSEYGRWPWPRRLHAAVARTLATLGVRSIMFDIEFPEPSDRIVSADTTGETIEQTVKHAHDVLLQLFDPATVASKFASDLARGAQGIPEVLTALREQMDLQITNIATAFQRVTVQPDDVLALAFRDTIAMGTKVMGVFFFEDAPTREAIVQNSSMERAFQILVKDLNLAFQSPELLKALGPESLVEVTLRAKAYLVLRRRFDTSDKDAVAELGPLSPLAIDWARDRILQETSVLVVSQFSDRSEDELVERVLKLVGSTRPLSFTRQARKFVRNARSCLVIGQRDAFSLSGGDKLGLDDLWDITPPVPAIAAAFSRLGYSSVLLDSDGKLRRASLVLKYRGAYVGHAALAPALDLLGVRHDALRVIDGPRLSIPGATLADGSRCDLSIPLDASGEALVNWAGALEQQRIPVLPIANVLQLVTQERKRDEHLASSAEIILIDHQLQRVADAARGDPTRMLSAQEAFGGDPDPAAPRKSARDWTDELEKARQDKIQSARHMLELGLSRFRLYKDKVKRPEDKAHFTKLIDDGERDLEEFWDVPERLRQRLAALLKDKVVVIGATAVSASDFSPNPLQEKLPKVMLHANLINMLSTNQFLERLDWAKVQLPVWAAMAILSAVAIGPAGFGAGIAVFLALVLTYALLATWLLVARGLWLDVLGPEMILFMSAFSIASRKFWQEERAKLRIRSMFETYLDPKVVQVLVADERLWRELGGTEHNITAFFSDLESFTSLSEMLTPEQVSQMLTAYLSPMTRIILDHEGMKDKYIGDAVVAIFGAPVPYENHAEKACLAALAQQEYLERLRQEWEAAKVPWYTTIRARGHDLRTRIGLNSGPAKVGNFGSEDSKNYTMIGDTVNLASRLEGANKEFHTFTMISESTYGQARGAIEVRELDRLRVKGKLEPVTVYQPLGPRGKVAERTMELVTFFHQGLALYRERRFDEALACFQKALALDPRDGPCLTYILRCNDKDFRESVGPEWDGVFEMKHK